MGEGVFPGAFVRAGAEQGAKGRHFYALSLLALLSNVVLELQGCLVGAHQSGPSKDTPDKLPGSKPPERQSLEGEVSLAGAGHT